MKAAGVAQALLEPSHLVVIPLVIIAKKVQQAVKGKHPKFGREAVPGLRRLAARNSKRDHHIAQLPWFIRWKRQNIRRRILPSIPAVEIAYAPVGNDGDGDSPPGARGRNRLKPVRQPGGTDARRQHDGDSETAADGVTKPGLWRAASSRRHRP